MAISWIGAIQFCLCPMLGCIAGPLFDAGYLKHLLIVGGGLYSFCFMMASISKEYYQVLLSHGIGVGIGMGLIFSPSVSSLQHHFARSRYRTLAYGFQATGSAIAGIYFPISLNYLLPAVGFGWTMRICMSLWYSLTPSGIHCHSLRHTRIRYIINHRPAAEGNCSFKPYGLQESQL